MRGGEGRKECAWREESAGVRRGQAWSEMAVVTRLRQAELLTWNLELGMLGCAHRWQRRRVSDFQVPSSDLQVQPAAGAVNCTASVHAQTARVFSQPLTESHRGAHFPAPKSLSFHDRLRCIAAFI